jgi:hypothetical protein
MDLGSCVEDADEGEGIREEKNIFKWQVSLNALWALVTSNKRKFNAPIPPMYEPGNIATDSLLSKLFVKKLRTTRTIKYTFSSVPLCYCDLIYTAIH